MGRYSKGNGDFELAQYLEYWNGRKMQKDLKGSSTKIMEPRLNLFLCMHTWTVMQAFLGNVKLFLPKINLINLRIVIFIINLGLRHGHDNGLDHRFNLFCPSTKKLTAHEIINAPPSIVSRASLLLFIRLLHRYTRRIYTLSPESTSILATMYDQLNDWTEVFNTFDFFPG